MRILLIEDDEVLLELLLRALTSQHYGVDTATEGQTGWDYAQSTSYDLILMDVGLPKLDGIALCQRLRAEGCSTPILLITARDASSDRIRGLDAGADDYLTKPLDLAELQARVRALLRRGEIPIAPVLQVGDLCLDPSSCQVSYAEKPLRLTPKEYSLLELLLRNPSRVFSRGQIVEHLWTFDEPPLEESVKVHIKGLRQKLKAAGAVDWIENVYGLGYRLSPKLNAPVAEPPLPEAMEQPFNRALEDLWQQYQGLMGQRLAALQIAVRAVEAGSLSEPLRQEAEQAAHKLAGVLGMLGRDTGTLLARQIELILLEPDPLLPAQTRQLVVLVQELGQLLDLTQPQSALPNPDQSSPVPLSQRGDLDPAPLRVGGVGGAYPLNVLVVDDDPVFLAALRLILEPWGIRLTGLDDPLRFWQVLPAAAPELVILDVEMPQLSGIELCQAIRNDPDWQGLPIFFLTAHRDSDTIEQMFAVGADDYVTKPIVGPELLTRITHRLERIRTLQTLASRDPVTGLANQPQSSRSLERLLQPQQGFCLAVIRVSELRQINCQYGHATGNQLLQQWGRLFQAALQGTAVLGYWGDGDFVVGLPGLTRTAAAERLSALLATLRQQIFSAPDGSRFQAVFSFGVAVYPLDGMNLQSLYQVASATVDPWQVGCC